MLQGLCLILFAALGLPLAIPDAVPELAAGPPNQFKNLSKPGSVFAGDMYREEHCGRTNDNKRHCVYRYAFSQSPKIVSPGSMAARYRPHFAEIAQDKRPKMLCHDEQGIGYV